MPSGSTSITGPAAQVPMHPVTSTPTDSVRPCSARACSRASRTCWQLEDTQPAPPHTSTCQAYLLWRC